MKQWVTVSLASVIVLVTGLSSYVAAAGDPHTFYSATIPVEIFLEATVPENGQSQTPGEANFRYLIGIGSVFMNPATRQFEIKELIQSFPDKDLFSPDQMFQSVFVSGTVHHFHHSGGQRYTFESDAADTPFRGNFQLMPLEEGYLIDTFSMKKVLSDAPNPTNKKLPQSYAVSYELIESLRARKLAKEFKRIHFGLRRPIMNGDASMYPKAK